MTGNDSEMATVLDTDFFVVIENDEDFCDFVTIDEENPAEPLLIDISDFELFDVPDFDSPPEADSPDFVSIDDNVVFLSDFQ
ncbi:MAG: hypothetical protein LBR64_00135 [Dysgonamonadaceae bacterium]|jgi:hypothetical protein|nr:hypothetical protein [Dysgonamonadaceae bacterium]